LRWKLLRHFTGDEAESAVEQLGKDGLQSDARFADSFARERFLRAYGPRRIRAELQQRGVSDVLIDAALRRVVDEDGRRWTDLAREALRRRFGDRPDPAIPEKARRQRFLYQRGFDPDVLRGDPLFEGSATTDDTDDAGAPG
jgi:regulatory protein